MTKTIKTLYLKKVTESDVAHFTLCASFLISYWVERTAIIRRSAIPILLRFGVSPVQLCNQVYKGYFVHAWKTHGSTLLLDLRH